MNTRRSSVLRRVQVCVSSSGLCSIGRALLRCSTRAGVRDGLDLDRARRGELCKLCCERINDAETGNGMCFPRNLCGRTPRLIERVEHIRLYGGVLGFVEHGDVLTVALPVLYSNVCGVVSVLLTLPVNKLPFQSDRHHFSELKRPPGRAAL